MASQKITWYLFSDLLIMAVLKGSPLQRDIWAGWKDSPLSALGVLPDSDLKQLLIGICRKTSASSIVTQNTR